MNRRRAMPCPAQRACDWRDGGFTLLELLVALVVLGFTLAGLNQTLRYGLTAWTRQERSSAALDEMAAADRTLRGLIERMLPQEADGPHADGPPALRGTSGTVQFLTTLPRTAGDARSRLVQAAIGVDASGRLVVRLASHPRATALAAPPEPAAQVLLTGVERVELGYFRAARRGDDGGWSGAWQDARLPALIRLHIEFAAGSGRHWPDIVAGPIRETAGEPGDG